MKPTISITDVLNELAQASRYADTADGFQSLTELVASTGWGDGKVRKVLKAAMAAGRLEVKRVNRPSLSGLLQPVPVYRIAPTPKKARE